MRALTAVMVFSALAGTAHAQQVTEIFKCVDAKGRAVYTNDRREAEKQKCEVVTRQTNAAPGANAAGANGGAKGSRPSDFPRESSADRSAARDRQRAILDKELASEQSALTRTQQELTAQQAARSGEESLRPLKDSIETHQKNIEALRRELANLNR
jgi:hypothetical protein